MIIEPVDNNLDLFLVKDFYPEDLLEEFSKSDHTAIDWNKESWQEQYPRRRLKNIGIYKKIDEYVKTQQQLISQKIKLEFLSCDTGFWLDEPGFSISPHLDNEGVYASMQIFLNINKLSLGTVFYNNDNSIRYAAPYILNTGYIMINGTDQWHGMEVSVPENTYRICSYTWFYPKV